MTEGSYDTEHPTSEDPAIALLIRGRSRDLGDGFVVQRVLPAPLRRLVGPFIFFDHMGPVELRAGQGMDVRPHPHVGLATVTYLFDGAILHRDSLGSRQSIRPGDVNWMTAGDGITHSERSDEDDRKKDRRVHGIQAWVALPLHFEDVAPAFHHHPKESLPTLKEPGLELRLIAGSAYGLTSPVEVHSPLFYADALVSAGARVKLPDGIEERAAYVVEGRVTFGAATYDAGTMIVFRPGGAPVLTATVDSRLMLLGGESLPGEHHIYWNFVASTKERIEVAKNRWRDERFPLVPGDDKERIPLPDDQRSAPGAT